MPKTTNYRCSHIRTIKWKNVTDESFLTDENVKKVFKMEEKLLEQESKPQAGCFPFLACKSSRPPLKLLVKEGYKSGKLTIYKKKFLGEGGFGVVSLGNLKVRNNDGSVNKMKIAVKAINHEKLRENNKTDDDIVQMIGDEVRAQTRCHHPNVIGLQFVIVYKDETLMGLEFAGHGALEDYFDKTQKMMCMKWMTKIMDAIHFCHGRGVVHLDIKPENILLDEDFNIKIADFGLSEMPEDDSFMVECRAGTPVYMAPEMRYGKGRNGKKCDIWSIGVLMYQMLLKRRPFDDDELNSLGTKVKKMKMERRSRAEIQEYLKKVFDINKVYFPPNFPIAPKRIICAMLNFDPLKRPNLDQIIALSWISKFRLQTRSTGAATMTRTKTVKTQQQKPTRQTHDENHDRQNDETHDLQNDENHDRQNVATETHETEENTQKTEKKCKENI